MKNPTSFRLTMEGLKLLKVLAESKGISQASMLEILIREAIIRENLK